MIRLARHGRSKLPLYRIVAAEKTRRRDGRFLENLGTLNPRTQPVTLTLKEDRVKYWISVGAHPSDTVKTLINSKLPGYLDDIFSKRHKKILAQRKARKARQQKAPGAAKTKKAASPAKASQGAGP